MKKAIDKVLDKLTSALSIIGAVGFIGILVVVMWNIIGRSTFNTPYAKAYEVVQYGTMACVLLGLTRTTYTNGHIAVTLITDKFPWRLKALILCIGRVVATAIYGIVAYLFITQIPEDAARNRITDLFRIPFQYIDWFFVIFLTISALIFFYQACVYFVGIFVRMEPAAPASADAAAAVDPAPEGE